MDSHTPKVIYLDIETAPSMGYYFDLWKEGNIVSEEKSWYILSYAYKINDGPVKVKGLDDYPLFKINKENDLFLAKDLWALLDSADIVIAHNGDKFDIRKINARLILHGLTPPSHYKTIDTLKAARRYFSFDSNRLDALGKYLGLGAKLPHTGFKLWKDCMSGEPKAWVLMKRYNKQDVVLLEQVYKALRPWMATHPNLNVYDDSIMACPKCRSVNIQRRGFRVTTLSKAQAYQCMDCGGWSKGKPIKSLIEIT